MTGIMQMFVAAKTAISNIVIDTYFNLVTLLLNTTSTNLAQNNTFQDSSTYNLPITRAPTTGPNSPTQGTFSPFSQTGWGTFVNGSGNYLETTTNSPLATTATTFTIETWLYMTATPTGTGYMGMLSSSQATGANGSWFFGPKNTRYLTWNWYDGAVKNATSTTTLMNLNTWYHVAISVNSNAISMYVNGIPQTLTGTTTLTNRVGNYAITSGQWATNSSYFYGFLSNTRIVSNQALFSGAFTPSTSPLTTTTVGATGAGAAATITGSVVFLANQSNRYLDNSVSELKFTRYGTTSIQAFSPFAPPAAYSDSLVGGSGYFSGTSGRYISFTKPALNTVFTYEFWVYPISLAAGQNFVISQTATAPGFPIISNNGTALTVAQQGANQLTGTANATIGAWNHIALVREGLGANQLKLYLNGANIGSTIYATTIDAQTSSIGGGPSATGVNAYFSSARLVNGTAVYTSNFTPPTAPLGVTTGGQNPPTGTQTQLLLNYTNANIYDASAKNDIETVAGAKVSTGLAKFGATSILFNGTTDYLDARPFPGNLSCVFNNGPWTIEFWFYTSSTARQCFIDTRVNTSSATGLTFYMNPTDRTLGLQINSIVCTSTTAVPLNTWNYIAVTSTGGTPATATIYLNGVSVASGPTSQIITDQYLRIGAAAGSSLGSFVNGYMDEIRITKGFARDVTTVPAAPFPIQ